MNLTFLILLFICHFLADFTWLSRPYMLKAKRFGTPIWPILAHAAVHGVLMFLVSLLFVSFIAAIKILIIQTMIHWIIDISKGKATYYIPSAQDNTKVDFWIVFGLDQFLHNLTIILIWFYI